MRKSACRLLGVAFVLSLNLAVWSQEKVDLEMVTSIRYEGFHNSKVMELASGLMDGIGPRLTGSPNAKRANEWTRDQLTSFGLVNAHLESWGPFGRGWANDFVSVRMLSPDVAPLIAYAKAWTPGTNGVMKGKCIRVKIDDKKDFEKYHGKLAGLIALLGPDPEVKTVAQPMFERLSDKELADVGQYQLPNEKAELRVREYRKRIAFQKELNKFLTEEKVLAVVDHGIGSFGGGTVFVQGGLWKTGETSTVPAVTVALEQWDRIARLLEHKKDVELELNVANTFYDDDPMQYNTIAEIPGSDKKDELVMVGAHL